jgi:hypothetical protein
LAKVRICGVECWSNVNDAAGDGWMDPKNDFPNDANDDDDGEENVENDVTNVRGR